MPTSSYLPGLITVADPTLERIHRIGQEAKLMIDVDRSTSFEDMIRRFEVAVKWLKEQRQKEN